MDESKKMLEELNALMDAANSAAAMLAGADSILNDVNDTTCGAAVYAQELVQLAMAKVEAIFMGGAPGLQKHLNALEKLS